MEKFIIETPQGYVQDAFSYDVRFTGVLNRALHFDSADEAWDFVDEYFTEDYDEQEALGIYVNKVDYSELKKERPESKSSGINIDLLSGEVDSLLDLINDQLGDDSPVKGNSLDNLLSIASKLLGK